MTTAEQLPIGAAIEALRAIVPDDTARAGEESDAIAGLRPGWHVAPPNEDALRQVLVWAHALRQAVAPVGGRTQLAIGNAPERLDGIVSLERLSGIVDYPAGDLTITVRAGTTAGDVSRAVADEGQWSPLDALDERATVGGLLAVGRSGLWRPGLGALRDQVLETRVVHPDGRVTRSGARVVKNVTGYDLNKLFIGSFGTLGVLSEVCLRLKPKPECEATLLVGTADAASAGAVANVLRQSGLDPFGLLFVSDAEPGEPGVRPPGEVLGMVKLAGSKADVSWLCDAVAGRLPAGTTWKLVDESETEAVWWNCAREALRSPSSLSGQLGTLPARLGELAASLPAEVEWSLRPWEGLLDWSWSGTDEEAPAIHAAVVAAAERFQAGRLLIHAPDAVRASGDVFGERPPGFALMRGLREAFDPERILNPGRFLRGL